ncbi:CHAT domain-containing tetratricopeptide repeat protein [Dokdonella soli]|uniref:CHAT domain-containing protein n=1 Tax=Dokdonella soli TaxID=529810 RepID=UPI0031E01746
MAARAASLLSGRWQLAREQAELALAGWHARHGVRARWQEVLTLHVIGNTYMRGGSSRDALSWFERGSALAIASFGADSAARIKIDTDRASVLVDLGRNSEALDLRETLLTIARRRFGENSFEAARAEGLVGAGLQEIGDYAAARRRYAHVEAVLASLPDAPAYERGIIANNFGNLLQEMGEEEAALTRYRQALAAWGEDERTMRVRAVVTANLGNTEYRLGHYETAIADFQRALSLREKADGKDSPGLGYALEGLGSSALALKRYAEAEQDYRRALDVRGRSLSPNHPTLAPLNFGLALARWGQGDIGDAFRYATLTAEHQQTLLATFATEFSERQSVAYRELLVPATALAVTLAAKRGDADSIAVAWRLTMVERELVERAQAHRLAAARSAHDPALEQPWQAWRAANSALGDAWLSTHINAERMAQLRADAESAERALWNRMARGRATNVDGAASVGELAHALPADGLMIAFTEGVADNPARLLAAGGKQTPEDWYAFTLAHDGHVTLRLVGDSNALSAQARAWYLEIRDPATDATRMRRNGLALRQALLDPIVAGSSARHLFIVPEGELFRVSFAALPDRGSGYLIENGTRVHTLAHESDLSLPASATASTSMLLAGAPDFPATLPAPASSERQLCLRAAQGFAAIPNAARELDGLHTLLSTTAADSRVQLITGSSATKENVVAALPHASIVHLATHGFSLDESCTGDRGARGMTLEEPVAEKATGTSNAATLSGLAFSGARVTAGNRMIGVLGAGELATLDLSHVDWIALSACDSGLGPIGRNEGVFGMRRALRLAGARTVIMSLWEVDDAATSDLMQSLYHARFVEHADVPDAMAAAMRAVLTARRAAGQSDHPYYWAAFIGEGGWR